MTRLKPVRCSRCGKVLQEAAPTKRDVTCPKCVAEVTGLPMCATCGDLVAMPDEDGNCARCQKHG